MTSSGGPSTSVRPPSSGAKAGEGVGAAPSGTPSLSIVLAVLNERPNLPELFDRLRSTSLPPWEAIVVDDGSTDGSREFVATVAAGDPRVRLIEHDGRQTTVAAQCQAIAAATGAFVVVLDADLQHPPELIGPIVEQLARGAALVVASRYAPGGSPGRRTLGRKLLSRGAEQIARWSLPPARRVSDPVSGFFGFRRSVFVPLPVGQRGYKLLLFLLVMARDSTVAEVPFRFEPRTEGATKVATGLGFVRLFLTEVRLARRLARQLSRRPAGAPAPSRT